MSGTDPTGGPTDASLAAAISEQRDRLERLEERFFYIAEDTKLATEIAGVQAEIDALRASLDQLHESPSDRLEAEIAEAARELEQLEKRFFYIAEDSTLATEIAGVQAHIDELRNQQRALSEPDS